MGGPGFFFGPDSSPTSGGRGCGGPPLPQIRRAPPARPSPPGAEASTSSTAHQPRRLRRRPPVWPRPPVPPGTPTSIATLAEPPRHRPPAPTSTSSPLAAWGPEKGGEARPRVDRHACPLSRHRAEASRTTSTPPTAGSVAQPRELAELPAAAAESLHPPPASTATRHGADIDQLGPRPPPPATAPQATTRLAELCQRPQDRHPAGREGGTTPAGAIATPTRPSRRGRGTPGAPPPPPPPAGDVDHLGPRLHTGRRSLRENRRAPPKGDKRG
jgi:hypothetical protein